MKQVEEYTESNYYFLDLEKKRKRERGILVYIRIKRYVKVTDTSLILGKKRRVRERECVAKVMGWVQ